MKKDDTVDFWLPADEPAEDCRACRMSAELYQNARQTMGEIRDMVREAGMSWDFLQLQIEASNKDATPMEKALRQMDGYSTGMGKSLKDLPGNIW